ncbi:MAG: hypothetical protein HY670_04540 [Chloroflexi bacterium]|nr:hypothetical protein [Chloroflexota bacterium]
MPAETERRRTEDSKPRRPGFYDRVLAEADQLDFELAAGVEGIDDEITLLRLKIKSILEHDPENIKHLTLATDALARLIKTRYNISKAQKKGLQEAIGNVLRDVAIPLGITIGGNIIK